MVVPVMIEPMIARRFARLRVYVGISEPVGCAAAGSSIRRGSVAVRSPEPAGAHRSAHQVEPGGSDLQPPDPRPSDQPTTRGSLSALRSPAPVLAPPDDEVSGASPMTGCPNYEVSDTSLGDTSLGARARTDLGGPKPFPRSQRPLRGV